MEWVYDDLNVVTEVKYDGDHEATERSWSYNAHNAVLTATDAENHTASNEYDVRDRRVSETDRNNLTTVYGFDDNNNLVSLTDPRNNTRTWSYDARNLKIEKQYPDGVADRCLYENDALGRLTKKTQQDDTEIRYVFDLAGRMTGRTYHLAGGALESTDTFTYDAASRIIATDKGRYDIQTAHTYADDGRALTESYTIEARTYTFTRTYDDANRTVSHTFADGNVMEWVYDDRNVVTEVKYDGDQVLTQIHDPGYRCTNQTFGNGLERTIAFARQDNLRTNDRVEDTGVIDDLNFDYTYAADKNVLTETSPNGALADLSFSATYDPGNRVATWNRADQYPGARESQSWNYDNAGNWNSTTIDGNTQNRTNNASDEATELDGNNLSYDPRGNHLQDEDNQDYTWDIDNRIAEIDPSNGSNNIEYGYDAFSRRVYKRQGGDEEVLLWWGREKYAEHESIGSQPVIQNDLHADPDGF